MGKIACLGTVAAAFCAATALAADRTIDANYTLAADETVDGVLTVAAGATVDLNGHSLTVQGLAGDGTIACGLAVKQPGIATVLFALGGVLFVISDTILSCHCFGTAKDPVYNRWVHYTYYAAQLLIAWSLAF